MAERRDSKNRVLWKGEYQKQDGRYMYRYRDAKGVPRFVYSWTLTQTDRPPKGKTSEKCLRVLEKEILMDIQNNIDVFNAKKTTLDSFFEHYIDNKSEVKPQTRTHYKKMYDSLIRDNLGNKKIADIKYSNIKSFYNYLLNDLRLKPRTIEQAHNILHSVFEVAVKDEYIRINPTNGVIAEMKKSNKWEKNKRFSLTKEEQDLFMQFIKSQRVFNHWVPLFTLLFGTGCRIGEALGLTWDDCDFDKEVIRINHSLLYVLDESDEKYKFSVSSPKTRSSTRIIPMLKSVKESLMDLKRRKDINGFGDFEIDGYSGFVFTTRSNKPVSANYINKAIVRIVNKYNSNEEIKARLDHRDPLLIPMFSVHIIRHTFCSRLCENDVNIKVIQEIMGHSDFATTMNIYSDITQEKKKISFREIEDVVM